LANRWSNFCPKIKILSFFCFFKNKTPDSPNDMNDLDELLKQYEHPNKSNIKENVNTQQQKSTKQSGGFFYDNPQQQQQQKLPLPSLSKYDTNTSDNRKGNIPLFSNTNINSEQPRRTSILKQPPKPSVDQSFDIDAILQGRSIHPQQQSKQPFHHHVGPTKNSASSRKDSDPSDWLNDDHITTKTHTQKVTTNIVGKPAIGLNPDEFFSNTNNNRDQNEIKPPFSTTKTSAKQYYMTSSRYKPGMNPRQTVRRDSFNWLTEPTNNSNPASMYFNNMIIIHFCF
jgi:hypothetical protein